MRSGNILQTSNKLKAPAYSGRRASLFYVCAWSVNEKKYAKLDSIARRAEIKAQGAVITTTVVSDDMFLHEGGHKL